MLPKKGDHVEWVEIKMAEANEHIQADGTVVLRNHMKKIPKDGYVVGINLLDSSTADIQVLTWDGGLKWISSNRVYAIDYDMSINELG